MPSDNRKEAVSRTMKKAYKIVLIMFMLALVALRLSICTGPSDYADNFDDFDDYLDEEALSFDSEETEDMEDSNIEITLEDGTVLSFLSDVDSIDISDSSLVKLLPEYSGQFSALRSIALSDSLEFTSEDVSVLEAAFPGCTISYRVIINGNEIPLGTKELDLSSLSPEMIPEAARELAKLPELEQVNMTSPGFSSGDEAALAESKDGAAFRSSLTIEDIGKLEAAAPLVSFDYKFFLYGKAVSTADERIEYENVNIGDSGVDSVIRPLLPHMGALKYLKLDKCEVSSPVMAQLRDDFPDIKVVWRIYFSNYGEGPVGMVTYNCLTDTDHIWATGCVTDHFAVELKYCTDVVYLDMGHNCITNIDFVSYMPKLEVAVLSITWVKDISPLVNCPNLEYLEIFSSNVTDLTPLASCTSLKHLNISNLKDMQVTDISCLYDLDLERLFCTMSKVPKEQQDKFMELHPDCECDFSGNDPSKSHWRFVDGNPNNTDPSNRVERYAKLYDQIGYGDFSNLSC